jgi:2-iminoacetate synthase
MKKEISNDIDFLNLLSPKALNYIEEMAQKAHKTSVKHFAFKFQIFV